MELRNSLIGYTSPKALPGQPWMDQSSVIISSASVVLRAGLGWIFELGIQQDMPFYQQKNLALINRVSFMSLLMALPGTLLLILLDFSHPFSLLFCGVLMACLILSLNASKRVQWAETLFAFAPAILIVVFSLLDLEASKVINPLTYILARQGLCFALLLPLIIFGFEGQRRVMGIVGACLLIFLTYEVVGMRLGAFEGVNITGLRHGVFSLFSVLQYMGLSACVIYMQNYTMNHELQAQSSRAKLQSLAIRDGMTGAFNHSYMEQFIADAINQSKRSGRPLSLLMIDVDLFKQVNDNFGHNAGDEVLIDLVRILNSNKRSTDYLGRWGGDELILLLTDTNLAGASNLAEKMRRLVDEHVFPQCKRLTISLGASQYKAGDTTMKFVAQADAAMYHAKRDGRNRVEVQKTGVSE